MDAKVSFCLLVVLLSCLILGGKAATLDGNDEQVATEGNAERVATTELTGSDAEVVGDADGVSAKTASVGDQEDVEVERSSTQERGHHGKNDGTRKKKLNVKRKHKHRHSETAGGKEGIKHNRKHSHHGQPTEGGSKDTNKNPGGLDSNQGPNSRGSNQGPTQSAVTTLSDGTLTRGSEQGQKDAERKLRLELVKSELLRKMKLDSVPKVDRPLHPLPFDFYVGENFEVNDEPDDDDTDMDVKIKQLFIYGDDITDKCMQKKGAGCYSFNISDKTINPNDVGSIELWIYKQRDPNDNYAQTFMVSELAPKMKNGKEILRSRNIVKRLETKLNYGWMKIYVKRTVQRWLSKPHRNFGLAVVCKTCRRHNHRAIFGDKEGLMPILVFNMNQKGPRRYRRSTQCNEGGNNCCHKETLEVNFRDIGWDFIMAPASIHPNFCTGSCNGILAAHYNHTRIMQAMQQSVLHDVPQITPCCSPVKFRTQSLMYMNLTNSVIKIDVPDLIVKSCGCA